MPRTRPFSCSVLPRAAGLLSLMLPMLSCSPTSGLNPFQDLAPVAMDGVPRLMDYDVAPLGELAAGQVLRVKLEGSAVQSALILAADTESDDAGMLAGGGPPGEFFDYRVQTAGRYFVYALFAPDAAGADRRATLTVAAGDPDYHPMQRQAVRVIFEPGYLTNPGLVDPTSFTQDEIQILADVSDQVRTQITERLRTVFAGMPVDISAEGDPLPTGPYSVLTYKGERRESAAGEFNDVIVPPLLPENPQCQTQVVFGEVVNSNAMMDVGNHVPDDQAVVYVGSFQGRGMDCRTAATDSVNNIVLGLAHTGAHEIGHLVGLFHVSLTDIMNRSPSLAFQRELAFARGQILVETATGPLVLTALVQDPAFYFRADFDPQP